MSTEQNGILLSELTIPIGKLKKIIKLIKASNTGHYKSTRALYRTEQYMQVRDEDFGYVCDEIILEAAKLTNVPRESLVTQSCWGVSYQKGDSAIPHIHSQPISWVFYVDCCIDCAPLVFPKRKLVIKPKINQLVLFQGIVAGTDYDINIHEVPIHECNHLRTCLSGNIKLNPLN